MDLLHSVEVTRCQGKFEPVRNLWNPGSIQTLSLEFCLEGFRIRRMGSPLCLLRGCGEGIALGVRTPGELQRYS
jgi:hypothetical protein